MHPDLMRSAVVDAQRRRASTNIDAEGLPREGLLEDALSEIAREEEAVRTTGRQLLQEAGFGDAKILAFIDYGEVKRRLGFRCSEIVGQPFENVRNRKQLLYFQL